MSLEHEEDVDLEIGHVLFMDIVGFSKLLVDKQRECSQRLNQVVRETAPFRAAEAADKLIRLPTGDGIVLVFFTNPEAPVRCAVDIAQALRECADFGLRMGIHSGPVSKISDVNDRANLAGSGINIAQRVMDCGDAGHILLSKRLAEDIEQHSKWRPHLHELGECEVKHGVRVGLVNLYTDEVGNAAFPEKVTGARTQRGGRIESLAVKPLDNFSGDASKEFFADGMTDELITKLSQIGALKTVIARSRMMKYKQSPKSSREIAFELKVEAIVEGSVVLAGDEARISAQLIEAATEKSLWADSYTHTVANVIRLQNEVALAIANAIALKLTPEEKARLSEDRVVDPKAYEYYLRGKGHFGADKDATEASIEMLEKSVRLDDSFAEAQAELSIAYASKAFFLEANPKEWELKAEKAVARALELEPDLPAARMARARTLWRPTTGFHHEETIAETLRALAVAPNSSDARFYLAAIYFHVGLIDEAIEEFKRADVISPDNPTTKFLIGWMSLLQGRYDEACELMKANETGMVRSFVEFNIASALFFSGREAEARARIETAKEKFKDVGGVLASMQALFFAIDGEKAKAEEKIAEAIEVGEGFGHYHHTTLVMASAYAILGDVDLAMKWLTYTVENGYPNLPWFERDPTLDSLRKHPAFIELLENLRPRFERLKAMAHNSAAAIS